MAMFNSYVSLLEGNAIFENRSTSESEMIVYNNTVVTCYSASFLEYHKLGKPSGKLVRVYITLENHHVLLGKLTINDLVHWQTVDITRVYIHQYPNILP